MTGSISLTGPISIITQTFQSAVLSYSELMMFMSVFRFWKAMNVLIAIWSVSSSSQNSRRFVAKLSGHFSDLVVR